MGFSIHWTTTSTLKASSWQKHTAVVQTELVLMGHMHRCIFREKQCWLSWYQCFLTASGHEFTSWPCSSSLCVRLSFPQVHWLLLKSLPKWNSDFYNHSPMKNWLQLHHDHDWVNSCRKVTDRWRSCRYATVEPHNYFLISTAVNNQMLNLNKNT